MKLKYTEEEVIVNGEYDLAATITRPNIEREKYPAIVLVSGTGSANRDGNMKNFPMNIYKFLAEFYTELGFVTIRYDKRGVASSKGNQLNTGVMDLVQDIISNVKFLEKLPYVDKNKIILMGHSEGCILTTIANDRYPVAGLILIAGAGTCLKTNMRKQCYNLLEEVKKLRGIKGVLLRTVLTEKTVVGKQEKLLNKVAASSDDVIKVQMMKFPAKWMKEHLNYTDQDIQSMLKQSEIPILAITGDKDVQANAKDLLGIKDLGKDNIQCVEVENMDHMLREYSGQVTMLNIKKQYKESFKKPLHPMLIRKMTDWINNQYGEMLADK